MPKMFFNRFQSLHFDTLALNPTRANWVERWLKAITTSLIRPIMWVSSIRDGNTKLRFAQWFLKVFDNG